MNRLIVLLKDAVDLSELKVDPTTRRILEGPKRRIGELDKRALEEALRIREKVGGEVCTLTVGDDRSKTALLEALAMGADKAYLVTTGTGAWVDALTTSILLRAAVGRLTPFDLILCGEMSLDSLSSQIGPRLAELLDLPLITYVKQLVIDSGRLRAVRDLEDADEVVQAELPAVVTVSREINEPRIPSLMSIMRAKTKPIITFDAASLDVPPEMVLEAQSIEIIGVEVPQVERKRVIVKGETIEESVEKLVHHLISEGVLEVR
ncbi:MAG: electron transfer flavoprotein subunit beta/FixA family protein [Candidatus Bathyarchaeia archaeon]|nr:electron transfer flavoprotein subunit beta/FixA family protein [Candidatus Bathyarchaeota archaeon]